MDELLKAIREKNSDLVKILARDLFIIKRSGLANKAQINEFERFAPCKIMLVEEIDGWVTCGKIFYGDIPPFSFS